jgi:hypothetical protein
MGETDRQRRAREASHRYFTAALARMFDPDRKNRTAGRIIDLWDARRARGAEPLFHPTIGRAIRAGRPWLTCYCPGCGVRALHIAAATTGNQRNDAYQGSAPLRLVHWPVIQPPTNAIVAMTATVTMPTRTVYSIRVAPSSSCRRLRFFDISPTYGDG